jgi:hypothetical protein
VKRHTRTRAGRCGAGRTGAIGGLPSFSREGEGGERKESGWSDRLLLADRSVEGERERRREW